MNEMTNGLKKIITFFDELNATHSGKYFSSEERDDLEENVLEDIKGDFKKLSDAFKKTDGLIVDEDLMLSDYVEWFANIYGSLLNINGEITDILEFIYYANQRIEFNNELIEVEKPWTLNQRISQDRTDNDWEKLQKELVELRSYKEEREQKEKEHFNQKF